MTTRRTRGTDDTALSSLVLLHPYVVAATVFADAIPQDRRHRDFRSRTNGRTPARVTRGALTRRTRLTPVAATAISDTTSSYATYHDLRPN